MPLATAADLAAALQDLPLLTPEQKARFPSLLAQFTDPKALAKELVQRGWLTPFQVNRIMGGKGTDLVLGPYVLLDRLGEGGMGAVYKARHLKMNRLVALKVIRNELLANPDAIKRFEREIQAAAQLTHPNIVAAYDAAQVGKTYFFAMEYVEGSDLSKLVSERGPLPSEQACDCIRQAALGLQHAHEQGLVHRDIKPHNLLLTKKGVVKILDMGLARLRQTADGTAVSKGLTQEGACMGTPSYMAPEQALDSQKADIRADIYSLGCTLYFLLAGKAPFEGTTTAEVLIKHQMVEPDPVGKRRPDVPAAVEAALRRMMAKKPEERLQTPDEVAAALASFAGSSTGMMLPPTEVRPRATVHDATTTDLTRDRTMLGLRPRGKNRRWMLAGAAVFAVGFVGVLILALGGKSDKPVAAATQPVKEADVEKVITNSIGMKLVYIPASKFTMGTSKEEIGRLLKFVGDDAWLKDHLPTEGPEHEVEISRPFYLGATEVTVGQFRQFVAANRKYDVGDRWQNPGWDQSDNHPVVHVSWDDAVTFCAWLTDKEGRPYRLPTEAEWEYSCRAGKSGTRYCFGNEEGDLGSYAWYSANSAGRTHPVARLKPNDWGLYDMHGNAWEWCQDRFDPNYYMDSPKKDPMGGGSGEHVHRGGSWNQAPVWCRSADRTRGEGRHGHIGFRVLLVSSSPGGVRP